VTARRRNRLLLRLWRWWRRRWSAPVVGAVKGAEYLATHSAMKGVEKAVEERKKRKEQGQQQP
jgi:hypothetical protein